MQPAPTPRRMGITGRVPESIQNAVYSAALGGALVAAAVGGGLVFHREHNRVGSAQENVLVSASRQLPGALVMGGSAEHHTTGYADLSPGGEQSCAAEASVLLHTGASPDQLRTALDPFALSHIVVDRTGRSTLRVRTYRPFGQNLLDWSCWQ